MSYNELPYIYIKSGNGPFGGMSGPAGYLGDDPLMPHGYHYITERDKHRITEYLKGLGVEV